MEDNLAKAEALRLKGIQKGILGQDTPEAAQEAFEAAVFLVQTLIGEDSSNQTDCYSLLIQIWIDYAELLLVLRDWKAANSVLKNAMEAHERLDCDSKDAKVLQVDIYRARSIADHYLKDENYKVWDERAIALLRSLREIDSNDERTVSTTTSGILSSPTSPAMRQATTIAILLATFLEYISFDQEDDHSKAADSIIESFTLLDDVLERNPHNQWARRRLANTLRNGSYVFRDAGMQDQAADAARGCVEMATELVQEEPTSPLYLFELYRCYLALGSDLVATQDDRGAILIARTRAVDAMTRLLHQVPMVADYWDHLACTLMDIAKLQQDLNEDPTAMLDRAIQSAEQSLCCCKQEPDPEYYKDLVRALSERIQCYCAEKKYNEALLLFERLYEVYSSMQEKNESLLEYFMRAMDQAHEYAKTAKQMDVACLFITRAVKAGQGTKSRKNRQFHASHLNDLACVYYEQKEYANAVKAYKQSLEVSRPLLAEYPWHFLLASSRRSSHLGLSNVYQAQGDIPSEAYHRREYLRYSAELHNKDYSEWTNDSESDLDETQLRRMRDTCGNMPRMTVYSVNCYFGKAQTTAPYSVYFTNPTPGRDPLEDQARTLKEDSDGTIPESVREAVRKLQDVAQKNHVSFLDLVEYTFSQSDSETAATEAETIEEEDDEHRSGTEMPNGGVLDAHIPSTIDVYIQD